jgi:hypothetical protein
MRDQLKNTQHQLKIVTAKVDVALSKCRRGETTYAMGWLKWGPN